jgi:hypothetical protein
MLFMAVVVSTMLTGCASTGPEGALATIDGDRIVTTHELRYEVQAPEGFRAAGPVHRETVFGGHPFAVTLAAWVGAEAFVSVHAERVLDGSGASDYRDLDEFALSCGVFRTRVQCAELGAGDIEGEHDLEFLAGNGFVASPGLRLRQLFRTTDDHDAEVVISYGERVASCAESDQETFDARMLATLRVRDIRAIDCLAVGGE